jgi:hypothetical protein
VIAMSGTAGDTPALSNIAYDDLVVGERMGPYPETVSHDMAARLAGPIGEAQGVDAVPPAAYPILFLKALRRSMGGIPAGSVLAKQELEFHGVLALGSDVSIVTWVGDKQVRRERPFVTIEFDIRDADDRKIVTGRKIIVWPTGPSEESA